MKARTFNYIFVMLLLGVIALTLGSSVLLRASVCMGLMLVLALFSDLGALWTVRVKTSVPESRIERGKSVKYTVNLSFRSVLPVSGFFLRLDDGGSYRTEMLRMGGIPFVTYAVEGSRPFTHRGVYRLGDGILTVSDVFGLFTFQKKFVSEGGMVTVLPCAHPLLPMKFQSGETGPETASKFPDDTLSPSGVREWRDGDLVKRIHWKLTMKTYDPSMRNLRPMVRTYDEAARPDTVVLPDMSRVDAVTERARCIEDGICEACLSIIRSQLETDNPVRLFLGGSYAKEVDGNNGADVLTFADTLAQARFDGDLTYEQAIAEATRRTDRTGAVVLVTSRLTARVADCAIRLRQMNHTGVALIWITDSENEDAENYISRLAMADVIARRDNPFRTEEQEI